MQPMAQHEITPEMLDAGWKALSEWDPQFEDFSTGAIRVYEAMQKADRRPNVPTVMEAFEILAERAKPPEGRDTPAYRRLCRAIIDEHIDATELARNGKPVMWP
jgi:hypothetical protein